MSGRTVTVPASLLHAAAASLESFCQHAPACTGCGANLDVMVDPPPHRDGCVAVETAKQLRKALTP